jgi:hypothetical protein
VLEFLLRVGLLRGDKETREWAAEELQHGQKKRRIHDK